MDYDLDKRRTNAMRENAYRASVRPGNVSRNTNRFKFDLPTAFATLAAAAVIGSAALGIVNFADAVSDSNNVDNFFRNEGYYECIEDCRWERAGYHGFEYGYNHDYLANWADKSENPDIALFSFYLEVAQNRSYNMSEVVSRMDSIGDCSNFDEYLLQKGFVDSNGKASTDEYEKVMTERVMAEVEIKRISQNNGIPR